MLENLLLLLSLTTNAKQNNATTASNVSKNFCKTCEYIVSISCKKLLKPSTFDRSENMSFINNAKSTSETATKLEPISR